MNGAGIQGSGHNKNDRTYIVGRDRDTDEATFLMALVADAGWATDAYMHVNQLFSVKATGEERVRYKVILVDGSGGSVGNLYATFSMEDAKNYAYFDRKILNRDPFEYGFPGTIITKAEYDSYVEMGVLPKLKVGTSQPKYP